ncbi:MAG: prephenate dehydrogenase [Peptococcaceae bacterium]|jgi:prephenate dehydrogenase|nr:prephenate dehydrogenase [Peptococcaceae bacterium]MDH7526062.1 prephenate dehydrogenase [Peptococcaceae bacterium]
MPINEIAIIGLGVIGGSLGKALKARLPLVKVTGIDVNVVAVKAAKDLGIVDEGTASMEEGVFGADLVFLATPVPVMAEVCRRIAPFLKKGAIITDVGSTKENVVNLMRDILPGTVHYVGGHPMAGSEKSGLAGASELLFENAVYILTPTAETPPEATQAVSEIVESLGARVMVLSPQEHDRKVAAVSHLPHLIASALVNTVGEREARERGYFALAAGGFRDTTRIASSSSEMWCDILLENSEALLPLVGEFKKTLSAMERIIKNKNRRSLQRMLVSARLWRNKVPTGMKGILPQVYELTVAVPDRPGVIGEISTLMGRNNINIIDIEIMRIREGDEGVIRLGFAKEKEMEKAEEVLEKHCFNVRKYDV